MMNYCDPNVTLFTVWYDHGISHCFMDTLASSILLLYMLTFGMGELVMYKRYGSLVDIRLKRTNCLYRIQIFLHYIRILSPILWLTLHYNNTIGPLYGHLILKDLSEIIVWIFSLALVKVERNYDLPTPPSQGHGIILVLFWAFEFIIENVSIVSFNGSLWWWKLHNLQDQIKLAIYCIGYICLLALFIVGIKAPGLATLEQRYNFTYRTLSDPETGSQQSTSASQGSTFRNVWQKLRTLLPFLWPKNSVKLQISVIFCILSLVAGRVVNLYVPLYHKWIVDSLTSSDGTLHHLVYRWDLIVVYVVLLLAQGGAGMSGGLISIIRGFLWIRVQQFTTREIQVHLYQHLHGLSLRWHLSRKTGEVLRVMDRGTNSINQLLSYILFNIAPTVIDITIAIVYFTSYFNIWFGIIVFITMAVYLTATVYVTEWRTKFRRNMNRLDNETEARAVDALLNFETVKYYNAEDYEVNRYREALLRYQAAEWLSMASMSALNFLQNFIIAGALLAGCLLCAWFVVQDMDNFTVGSYVLFTTYIIQLYQPLNWLGTYYRMIQTSFIDMENMFDLLHQNQEVKDDPDAAELIIKQGRVEFKNVNFHYLPEKPILKNVSFVVEPGKKVALVGPSGGGKSTIIRLLFRFYDVHSGLITIDGQDVTKVTQKSLRQHIGVVPQDTVLFNDTIMYNIKYGKVLANESEIFGAAQAAEIHDKILSFPDGYNTMVGERGLKLSGGEKQRVAIARTILKSPDFVLLDEATSALDTQTERLIQASLNEVCVGRTTVVVAHRLSTIVDVDQILVLKDGEIIERGNHNDLLASNGFYATMWKQQLEKPVTKSASSGSLQLRKQAASNSAMSSTIDKDSSDIV